MQEGLDCTLETLSFLSSYSELVLYIDYPNAAGDGMYIRDIPPVGLVIDCLYT